MRIERTEFNKGKMSTEKLVNSPPWTSRRFRSTFLEEDDMETKKKYWRPKTKRGVLYLQERHCGVLLNDCLHTTDERIAERRRREIHIAVERGEP